jgi:hypothetical protein
MDPIHLNLKGEAVALLARLRTYQTGDFRDGDTRLRSVEMIKRGLPTPAYIHPRHMCGMVWDTKLLDDTLVGYVMTYAGMAPPF